MVWPRFKVFWFSKDNPTAHSERTKKRQTEEEWTGMHFASSAREAENRTRWKGIVANLSVMYPDDLRGLWDRIEYNRVP